jgi:hypothetical protein
LGQEKLILSHNMTNYETKQGDFWDRRGRYYVKYGTEQGHFIRQEKLTYGHYKTKFGTKRGDFLGQEKSILGLFKMNYGT